MRPNRRTGAESPHESNRRTLVYYPIIHDQVDLGALGASVKKAALKKTGLGAWKRKLQIIDRLWTDISKSIDLLSLSYDRVRIYQDGLPVCGKEIDIVKDLAGAGSRNHVLLLRMIDRGARLMGTESLEMLVEECERAESGLEERASSSQKTEHLAGPSLLDRRDAFIARRINETLLGGEVGMLFLGMLHNLAPWLDGDIEVIYPIQRPLER
ncbi:MAG: hypothetical protein V2B18_10080 [Pseudomonadota bacterium]